MKTLLRLSCSIGLLILLAGCGGTPALPATPEPVSVSTSSPSPTLPPATPSSAAGETRLLRLWLPPQFDPSADTPAGRLLQARLDEFEARRPGLQVEVRIKAASGPNGLVENLSAAYAAAPAILPDLVALSRADLEAAAFEGLLHPLDGLTLALNGPDWYPYARQLAQIQNTTFGLPFAGDVLVLAGYADPLPARWAALEDKTYLFAAADPQASFGLAMYLSSGTSLTDVQGQPHLDEDALESVLSFYARSVAEENLSSTVLAYGDNSAAWKALEEQHANLGVVWTDEHLQEKPSAILVAPLPGLGETSMTLARGSVWALAGSRPENQALAVELAEFLSEGEFLAEWSQAAGVLPPRPTALAAWQDPPLRAALEEISASARLLPPNELIMIVGIPFQQAIQAVLSGEALPAQAARTAAEQVK
jgi:multiple sugar transport system substrate-binding protein